jgi:oxygen-independent coproporphyrinogen-3 oxidase
MLKSIEKEIEGRARYLNQQKIRSIYFGGGTPSILDDIDIKKLLSQIIIPQNTMCLYNIICLFELLIELTSSDLSSEK